MAVTKTNLRGRYRTHTDKPQRGRVGFVANVDVVIPPEDMLVPIDVEWATLDGNGEFSIDLIPTDAPGASPEGWAYTVWPQIEGAAKTQPYDILLPYSPTPTQLADISPGAPAPPEVGYILSSTLTTKGDILVRDATGVTRLPTGPNGYLLSSDDAEATGHKWVAVSGGGGDVETVNGVAPVSGNVQLSAADIPAATPGHNHDTAYDAINAASTAVTNHAAAGDPHPGYALESALGDAAAKNTGTSAGTLAAGDDVRFTYRDLAVKYGGFALNGDPMYHQTAGAFGPNAFVYAQLPVPAGQTISEIYVAIRTVATHDGVNFGSRLGIYNLAGSQVALTAVDDTLYTATGWRGGALTGGPIAAQSTDRYVYAVAFIRGLAANVGNPPNANDPGGASFVSLKPGSTVRMNGYANGQSSIPGSFDPTSFGTTTGFACLFLLK